MSEETPVARTAEEMLTIETYSWVNRLVGGDGTGCVALREPARPGDTVLRVLRRLGVRFPELAAAVFARDPEQIAEYFAVMVNHRAPEEATLDVELRPGDTLSLLGQFSGG